MKSRLISLLLHVGAVFAMLHFTALLDVQRPQQVIQIADTKIVYHPDKAPPLPEQDAGGGGRDVLPASLGEPPKAAPRQFLPPTTRQSDHVPALPVEPTIAGLADGTQPVVIGLPGGVPGPPSDGPGGPGGIGPGKGRGIGPGRGDGIAGRGQLGWSEGPTVLYQIEPEYSEEARKARLTGTVVLFVDIDEKGRVSRVEVRQSLGLGLDEKAIEAIRKWRFRPARKDGKPVTSSAIVDVGFHLL
ncbi:MAG: energy transducer TonB [Bryobacteraceae bacterium]